jgi:hypothetical protein
MAVPLPKHMYGSQTYFSHVNSFVNLLIDLDSRKFFSGITAHRANPWPGTQKNTNDRFSTTLFFLFKNH